MVAAVMPAVVRITTFRQLHTGTKPDGDVTGVGAGYIIDPAGYIGTNKHLIDGARAVFVVTSDGARYRAKIVGATNHADIALLRIDAGAPLPFVQFGDSDKVRVGERVIAIGSPLGFDNTVTSGIVSAVNRDISESPFDEYLQTDAPINHGNSGGPLLNEAGEVIGMTSVIFSPDPGSSGLGFAVPSNSLQFVFNRLIKTGKIEAGMLPIHTQPLTAGLRQAFQLQNLQGALITSLDDSEIRRQGKIAVGDVVTTFNGQRVSDPRELAREIARSSVGSDATLGLNRDDHDLTVHVTIEAVPEASPLASHEKPHTAGLELTTERQRSGQQIVKIASVAANGTAAESGLQKGDILVEVQHTPVSKAEQALAILHELSANDRHFAAILVRHNEKVSWIALELPD